LSDAFDLKHRIAKEAATLIYFGAEKEYKQAKQKAIQVFGVNFLPSNMEVALELEKIAEENEGSNRKERLMQMRKEALEVMKFLDRFSPVLIGSVWRGTIRQGSDIDISVFSDDPGKILIILKSGGVKVTKTAWATINKRGATHSSFHIYGETESRHELEIVVRCREEMRIKRKCEIFGDELKGLNSIELEEVLKSDPTQQFIPS
jgi:predicted nucleotidyltransferase